MRSMLICVSPSWSGLQCVRHVHAEPGHDVGGLRLCRLGFGEGIRQGARLVGCLRLVPDLVEDLQPALGGIDGRPINGGRELLGLGEDVYALLMASTTLGSPAFTSSQVFVSSAFLAAAAALSALALAVRSLAPLRTAL
jgi:hypothetical protein